MKTRLPNIVYTLILIGAFSHPYRSELFHIKKEQPLSVQLSSELNDAVK